MAEPIAADRIEITVLVDNVTDSLSSTPSFVTREWIRLQRQGMKRVAGGALCCASSNACATAHWWSSKPMWCTTSATPARACKGMSR